jgi:hypothetical protein
VARGPGFNFPLEQHLSANPKTLDDDNKLSSKVSTMRGIDPKIQPMGIIQLALPQFRSLFFASSGSSHASLKSRCALAILISHWQFRYYMVMDGGSRHNAKRKVRSFCPARRSKRKQENNELSLASITSQVWENMN